MGINKISIVLCALLWLCGACSSLPDGDPDNGGLVLPEGFEAVVVADSLPGRARHLAIHPNGDIYVKGIRPGEKGQNWVLRDTDGDGKADIIKNFGPFAKEGAYATEMRIFDGYLYTSSENIVYRYKLPEDGMIPDSEPEIIVADSGRLREHIGKPIAFDGKGNIYVPFGAPSDACQESNRVPSSPGMMPCPLLDSNAGIWRFDATKKNQFRMKDGVKVATGVRSIVGMDWNTMDNTLYAVVHGRDGLGQTWREYFDPWESALLPSEGFYKLSPGANAGWPYFYFDQMKGKVMPNPEYGGDGNKEIPADTITAPVVGFPGHWAPNDIHFYKGNQFPDHYKNGAFVAFHGSTNRAPYPQAGYIVGFVPFANGKAQDMEVFADGFTGVDTVVNTSDARHRPMGIAMGPDGSIYISDSQKGKIWRVMYTGDKKTFGEKNLANMKERTKRTYVKTPDIDKDNLDIGKLAFDGQRIYENYCRACHQRNGKGDEVRFPPLLNSEWVTGDKKKLAEVILNGLNGPVKVAGKEYNNVMPQFDFLTDQQIADLLSYVRQKFGNNADSVKADLVKEVRSKRGK